MAIMATIERNTKSVTVAIPTYGRDRVLIETVYHLLALRSPPDELVIIDQTPAHDAETISALAALEATGTIQWIRLDRPSITHAMNVGLVASKGDVVLFVDDDIIPQGELVEAHRVAHASDRPPEERRLVAGRVLQPWHVNGERPWDRLASDAPGIVEEFIGCNFSVDRGWAIGIGGFDERFVRVAYRYEAEFGERAKRQGTHIRFVPDACIHHLRSERGGTRSFGDHLRSASPAHSVGLYYFLLRTRPRNWWRDLAIRPFRSVATRFHLRNPWWIPLVFVAQLGGIAWALVLLARGPVLIGGASGGKA